MEWIVIICIISTIIIGVIIAVNSKRTLPPSNQSNLPRVEPRVELTQNRTNTDIESQILWEEESDYSQQNLSLDQQSQISWEEQLDYNQQNLPLDQLIGWVDIPDIIEEENNFLNVDTPENINDILRQQIGCKDPYTQEEFLSGQRVYLCYLHQIAYHEDTWIHLEQKCVRCGNGNNTQLHQLPEI